MFSTTTSYKLLIICGYVAETGGTGIVTGEHIWYLYNSYWCGGQYQDIQTAQVSWSVSWPKGSLSIPILPSISVTIIFIVLKPRIWHTHYKFTFFKESRNLQAALHISKYWVYCIEDQNLIHRNISRIQETE